MFTGLVAAIGTLERLTPRSGGLDITVRAPFTALELGESIAIDGACLTVTSIGVGVFDVHVITTTLERTMFADRREGCRVNLERALRVGDRLGGHVVQGHIDGVGTIAAISEHGDARLLDIAVPAGVAQATVALGSVTVDGVSLTVNALPGPGVVQVALIPFTLEHTTLSERLPGDRVHLEGDPVGKYVRHMLDAHRPMGER